ncbi:MAG: hypothetical protein ISS25_04145 [Nanoarchaeota archaeon]|nr:hypothetical protein [DPANN group archaeon]MBL7116992.1 hypothetical protein [Nanoarchaeota archaeon]
MRENKELSRLEKIAWGAVGPVLGILPERVQMKITKGNQHAAFTMSASSRVVNGVWAAYSTASLISKAFGVDIDPSPGNIVTYAGIPLIPDTVAREVSFAFYYVLSHPFGHYHKPWGEPILTVMDNRKHPQWYATH